MSSLLVSTLSPSPRATLSPSRRAALLVTTASWLLCSAALGQAAEPDGVLQAGLAEACFTGKDVPELACFDRMVCRLLKQYEIPGGAVAVARDGRLVLAHGYGLADLEGKQPVQPDSLMRIASVSKPFTAAAILVLLEQGRLRLEDRLVDWLSEIAPLEGQASDPRLQRVTLRQLLQHTGGFDRQKSFDPMFHVPRIAERLGCPLEPRSIIRYMWDRPLDFDPGSKYAYSNFGYCLLGRVIEEAADQPYEAAVNRLVLQPLGIRRMRLGHTRRKERAEGEVCYYAPSPPVPSVLADVPELVPAPYGEFSLEVMDAHGGWIASAVDLVRFAVHLDGRYARPLLRPATVRLLEARPAPPVSVGASAYYGLGWMIRPVGSSANWWHAGELPGSCALLVRTHHGLCWAAVFNSRPSAPRFLSKLDTALWRAAGEVERWPQHDLFPHYR